MATLPSLMTSAGVPTPIPSNLTGDGASPIADPFTTRSLAWLICVIPIYTLLIVVTLTGNAFVMAAYAIDVKIRVRPANMLILNLSISDFLVGITLIINFFWLLTDDWKLGEIPCKLWIVMDYTSSYMSVITILLISLDRFWMVRKKLAYRSFQTHRRISITLVICWTSMIVFYATMAFGWSTFTKTNPVDYSDNCEMEYLYNVPFSVIMIFVECIIPLVVIVCLNIIVYLNIRMRSEGLVRTNPDPKLTPTPSENNCDKPNVDHLGKASGVGLATKISDTNSSAPVVTVSYIVTADQTPNDTAIPAKIAQNGADNHSYNSANDDNVERDLKPSKYSLVPPGKTLAVSTTSLNSVSVSVENNSQQTAGADKLRKKAREYRKHRRAAIVLFALVVTFVICWLPYQFTTVITAIMGDDDAIPFVADEILTNLLWVNSTINPFLYAAVTVQFRRNFARFLCLENLAWCQKRTVDSSGDGINSSDPHTVDS